MLTKRRIAVTPTDEAFVTGSNIVAYTNGADHPKRTPVPTEEPSAPSASRALVHSFMGALVVDCQLDALEEYIYGAAVNEAGVLACRVGPLPSVNSFYKASKKKPSASAADQKMVFFAGRQRLWEWVISADGLPDSQCIGVEQFRMQALRSARGDNASVHVARPNVLCVCLSESHREQLVRFEDRIIKCIGPGRNGSEMTVLLDNMTVAMCTLSPSVAAAAGEAEQQATPSKGRQQAPKAVPKSDLQITSLTTLPQPPNSNNASPLSVLWAGRHIMWVTYDNGSVYAFCASESAVANEEVTTMQFDLVHADALLTTAADHVFLSPDSRTPSLHYCFARGYIAHFGTIRLHVGARRGSAIAPSMAHGVPPAHYHCDFGESIQGIRHSGGRYHVLTQSRKAAAPLYVTTLPLTPPKGAESQPTQCLQIMYGPEENLLNHCRQCEALLDAVNGNALRTERDAMNCLTQLMDLRRSVYALMCREQDHLGGATVSTPQRLLTMLGEKYALVTAYLLLIRVGASQDIDEPISTTMGLVPARESAMDGQEAFRLFVQEAFHSSAQNEDVGSLALWPTKATLCIDAILAHLGHTAETSLATILAGAHDISAELALLVLYVSFQGDAERPAEEQARLHALRGEFVRSFRLPVELCVWAYASYAVDHGINPCEKDENDQYTHVLSPVVAYMGLPPLATLLPALVNGLVGVAAVDTAYHLSSVCLSQFSGGELPPSLGVKLLFVALQTRAHSIVESVYSLCKGTVLESFALKALATSALQRGDVSPLRGLVDIGGFQERVVERTLVACEDTGLRAQVLLPFYVLMQRYADALQRCGAVSEQSQSPATAQRAQLVASHLRSLMPHGNEEYMLHNASSSSNAVATIAAKDSASLTWASAAPSVLESDPKEMAAQLRRTFDRCASHARPRDALSSLLAQPGPSVAYLRPSQLLSSLDRGVTPSASAVPLSLERSSSSQQQPSMVAPTTHMMDMSNEEEPSMALRSSRPAFAAAQCEVMLKRSGKECGRSRPCPYHDRK